MQTRKPSQRSLPSYPGVPLCLRRGGAADRRIMFFDPAILQHCVYECVSRSAVKAIPEDMILWCCDGAAWHKSKSLQVPENIELFYIPPYTPEMNPIEQIWKELRKLGFRNEIFATLERVVNRLCETICRLSSTLIRSITGRDWVITAFN